MKFKFLSLIALALSSAAIANDTTATQNGPTNKFANGEMVFQSVLISNQMIRVNIGFTNTGAKPVFLWSSNYQDKCVTASLNDDKGNEFKCVGESLFAMSPYSKAGDGVTVAPGTTVGLQYQFERGTATPGEKFEFSASPLLFVERDSPDENQRDRLYRHSSETLGINFGDLPAKVRPVAAKP